MLVKGSALALVALAVTSTADAAPIVGIDELNNLVTFDSAAPGTITGSRQITGVGGSLVAIDFRPLNNVLYGLGSDLRVYTISRVTGAATAVSGELALTGSEFAFDFNPTIDRLRIVSNTNQNYVFNPNDGSLTQTTNVFYAPGDPNAGRNPDVTAGAYTSANFGDPAGATQLYSIDTTTGVLTTQANSLGTLRTVGSLGQPLGSRTSFDILGTDAFVQNGRNFFSINLQTGALSQIGQTDRALFGIAAAVPEPATWAMMIAGFGAIGGALRTRRAGRKPAYA